MDLIEMSTCENPLSSNWSGIGKHCEKSVKSITHIIWTQFRTPSLFVFLFWDFDEPASTGLIFLKCEITKCLIFEIFNFQKKKKKNWKIDAITSSRIPHADIWLQPIHFKWPVWNKEYDVVLSTCWIGLVSCIKSFMFESRNWLFYFLDFHQICT